MTTLPRSGPGLSRRSLLRALGGGALALGGAPWNLAHARNRAQDGGHGLPELSGTEFDLVLDRHAVTVGDRRAKMTLVNGLNPGPLLRWREGDWVTIRVTNRLDKPSSIHWHGILLPADMDGVPGLAFPGIAPGETFTYRFPVIQSGTFWYHSHSHFQEQTGLHGPLLIEPRSADLVRTERDYVIMLTDWTDENPDDIFYNLRVGEGYYNYRKRTLGDFIDDVEQRGLLQTLKNRWRWGMMRMDPRDISDVTGRQLGGTYSYLINGHDRHRNWTGLFRPGEKVRLRFINGSAMTFFDVRIPGLKMTVVAADGCNVEPVAVDQFRIGVAETYDVVVEPVAEAYTIFAESLDRSGYVRGTLAQRPGLQAAIPPMDPIFTRTMKDMGMAMHMGHGADMKNGASGGHDMAGMQMTPPPSASVGDAAANDDMSGMSGMTPVARQPPTPGDRRRAWPQPQDVHLERGPAVVNIAAHPTNRLDEPGDGLDHVGRRVLVYTDLVRRADGPQNAAFDDRPPEAEVLLHLTGNMERYIFGFNGMTFEQNPAVRFPLGQRIRVTLINDTMMEHPIHLHGMFTQLNNGHGRLRPLKHTVIVQPGEKLQYDLTANAPGRWAYHCHYLFHMAGGMFTSAEVL